MAKLKIAALADDKPVKVALELPAAVHRDLVAYAERVSGLPPEAVGRFFATGMLLNVIASMGLQDLEEPWAARLVGGLKGK